MYNAVVYDVADVISTYVYRRGIVEGSYSHHPYFKDYADLKIFMGVDEITQKERILKRNGSVMLERFVNEWIPMENTYFSSFQIKEKSDFYIVNEG